MEVHSEMNEFYNERIIREPPLPSHTHTHRASSLIHYMTLDNKAHLKSNNITRSFVLEASYEGVHDAN